MWIVRVKIGWKPKQIDFKLDEDKDEDKINMYKTVNVDGKMILGWILKAFFSGGCSLSDGLGNGVGEGRLLQLLALRHFCTLLQLVVVDDVLKKTRAVSSLEIPSLQWERSLTLRTKGFIFFDSN